MEKGREGGRESEREEEYINIGMVGEGDTLGNKLFAQFVAGNWLLGICYMIHLVTSFRNF